MPAPIATLYPPMTFAGVVFPVESIKISGGIRLHVHEFPHMAGGAPEKLGRSLYRISVVGHFQDVFLKYPNLYPQGLTTLIEAFEAQKTTPLIVPTLGTLDAFALKWDREWTAKILSGEKMTIEFMEDQSALFVLHQILTLTVDTHGANLAAAYAKIKAQMALDDAAKLGSLLDDIQSAVNAVQSVLDQGAAFGNYLEAKLNQIANMCDTVDRWPSMQDPKNWSIVDAAHELWESSIAKLADLNNTRVQLQTFTVPMLMDIGSVSSAIYSGDSTRVDDLLSLNAFPNSLRIPAGTPVRFYP